VAFFQAQPEGPRPFFRPAAQSVADVGRLHDAPAALPDKKMVSAAAIKLVLTGPKLNTINLFSRGIDCPMKSYHMNKGLFIIFSLLLLSGCASVNLGLPSDPLEPVNRVTERFNQEFDKVAAKPVAKGYRFVTPDPLDRGITNFFNNLADIPSAANNLLQLKPVRALSDVGRVCVNTTIGLLGFFDVASDMGLPIYREDLGQTLGYWGVGDTPYLMIPIFGPSTLRDLVGRIGDFFLNPISYSTQGVYWSLVTLNLVDTRADLLEAGDVLDEAAVDRYSFLRELYLQKRKSAINDGQTSLDDDLFDENIFMDMPQESPPQE
jgi:phospholipid-binding lipoprotein MlaA